MFANTLGTKANDQVSFPLKNNNELDEMKNDEND